MWNETTVFSKIEILIDWLKKNYKFWNGKRRRWTRHGIYDKELERELDEMGFKGKEIFRIDTQPKPSNGDCEKERTWYRVKN